MYYRWDGLFDCDISDQCGNAIISIWNKLCSGEQGGGTVAKSRWNSARIEPSGFQPWSGSLQARNYTPALPLSTLEVKRTTGWGENMWWIDMVGGMSHLGETGLIRVLRRLTNLTDDLKLFDCNIYDSSQILSFWNNKFLLMYVSIHAYHVYVFGGCFTLLGGYHQ